MPPATTIMITDHDAMTRALHHAEQGRGSVEPNPLVGAVIVREGKLVGEGWHRRFGEAHAEVNALTDAGEFARGATLFVTLEPCCHHGKTPPCTDAVLRAGIARVVVAMRDPFPRVAGQGLDLLRARGLQVEVGLCEAEARQLNAPYLKLLATGKPYVHAKWAMTLDGKIATRTGHSQWISGEESRAWVHRLRGRVDAVIVGAGTLRADDPLLTARPPGPRTATRIVVAGSAPLPSDCQLLRTAGDAPVLLATGADRPAEFAPWCDAGAQVLVLPGSESQVDLPALFTELGSRRMTNVLIEGGAGLLGSLLDAREIDEVHVFIAPRLIGGSTALGPIGGHGVATIGEGMRLTNWEIEQSGEDWLIHGRLSG